MVFTGTLSHNDPIRAVAVTNSVRQFCQRISLLHCTSCKLHCNARTKKWTVLNLFPLMKEGQDLGVFSHLCPDLLQNEDEFTTYFIINITIK
jgi:hypothetical protein